MSSGTSEPQTWFITGCSQSLGLELSKAVLTTGQNLVASSRNPSKSPEAVVEVERLGGAWVELDVASSQLENQARAALASLWQDRYASRQRRDSGAVEDFRLNFHPHCFLC